MCDEAASRIVSTADSCYSYEMQRHTISAQVKNGSVEPLDPAVVIPPEFIAIKQLWDGRGKRGAWKKDQWSTVRGAIEPLLYATIDPEIEHYDNGLLNPRGTIHSQSIELLSCSFEKGPVPIISAHARFEMAFDRKFETNADFYVWQESTDYLDWGTNFGWRFPDGSEYDAACDNDGIELEVLYLPYIIAA